MTWRREYDLLPQDQRFLEKYGCPWETITIGNNQWLLIHEFPICDGYNHAQVTAAIRMETGYPDAQLDMVYFYPALARKDGKGIPNTGASKSIDGVVYQRWSRHRTSKNPWKPGFDCLETHVLLIQDWLERELE